MTETPAPRRARHLMDPDRPRAPRPPEKQPRMDVEKVKKWVLSVLAATTILHLSWGLVVSAAFMDGARQSSRIGLSVIAGAFGVLAFAAALVIHQKRVWHPLLLLGIVPTIVGIWISVR